MVIEGESPMASTIASTEIVSRNSAGTGEAVTGLFAKRKNINDAAAILSSDLEHIIFSWVIW
jgi:hypothetical protein